MKRLYWFNQNVCCCISSLPACDCCLPGPDNPTDSHHSHGGHSHRSPTKPKLLAVVSAPVEKEKPNDKKQKKKDKLNSKDSSEISPLLSVSKQSPLLTTRASFDRSVSLLAESRQMQQQHAEQLQLSARATPRQQTSYGTLESEAEPNQQTSDTLVSSLPGLGLELQGQSSDLEQADNSHRINGLSIAESEQDSHDASNGVPRSRPIRVGADVQDRDERNLLLSVSPPHGR